MLRVEAPHPHTRNGIENPCVGGSIPPQATIFQTRMKSRFHAGFVVLMARHFPQSVCNLIAHERASIPVDGDQSAVASDTDLNARITATAHPA